MFDDDDQTLQPSTEDSSTTRNQEVEAKKRKRFGTLKRSLGLYIKVDIISQCSASSR